MSKQPNDRTARTGARLAKKLRAACQALREFRMACFAEGHPIKGADDTRITLHERMDEYAGYLEYRYPDGGRHEQRRAPAD